MKFFISLANHSRIINAKNIKKTFSNVVWKYREREKIVYLAYFPVFTTQRELVFANRCFHRPTIRRTKLHMLITSLSNPFSCSYPVISSIVRSSTYTTYYLYYEYKPNSSHSIFKAPEQSLLNSSYVTTLFNDRDLGFHRKPSSETSLINSYISCIIYLRHFC